MPDLPRGTPMEDQSRLPLRPPPIFCLACMIFLLGPGLALPDTLCASDPAPKMLSKSLTRTADPVIINNQVLGGKLDGVPVPDLQVLAYRNNRFEVIPFQVDERGPEGELILTQGPLKGKQLDKDGNYVACPSWGVFDHQDEIVLLARDTGDRTPLGKWPQGAGKTLEIKVRDPTCGLRSWIYVASFPSPPLPNDKGYIDYQTIINQEGQPEVHILASHYHAAFSDLSKPVAQNDWRIIVDGREGRNIMQTFRTTIFIRVGFIGFDFSLKNIAPKRLGQIDGPVRVVRRIRNGIRLAGIPIPDYLVKKLAGTSLDTDSIYYPDFFYFTGTLSFPHMFVKFGSKSWGVFTTDFNRNTVGMYWLDSRNPKHVCLVDGIMSPQERSLDDSIYQWSLLHGEEGGWMNILSLGEGFQDLHIRLYYLDNAVDGFMPEGESLQAAYGSTGYSVRDFHKIKKGKPLVFTTNVFSIAPDFQPGEERMFTDLIFHPLELSVTRTQD